MKSVFMFFIKGYRRFLSPLKTPSCRFYPSCSSYALQAYQKHGVIKGSLLTIYRLLRCNPFNIGGVDYVPEKFHLLNMGKRKYYDEKMEEK